MYLRCRGDLIKVDISRKRTTRNMYMRLKEDNVLYVTCNTFTSDNMIKDFIAKNISSVEKMYDIQNKKSEYSNKFYYMGREYNIVNSNDKDVRLGEDTVFIPNNIDIDKWYKEASLPIYKEHLDKIYNRFSRRIPYPSIRVRKMKTRWGVCKPKDKVITLNSELIKKDLKYLDYVIVHELSHFIEQNHSSRFWSVVEENCPNYLELRRSLKDYE